MNRKILLVFLSLVFGFSILIFVFSKGMDMYILPHGAKLRLFSTTRVKDCYKAIIICPGGGYSSLTRWREGYLWVPFFLEQGYTVAVLEYRMPKHNYQIPMTDAIEAMKLMRGLAANSKQVEIGMMGFSAGGHLVSTLANSSIAYIRPDFTVLFYPVISMKSDLTHKWTHDNLLGDNCTSELEELLSCNLHVTKDTPPVFIAVSANDSVVKPANSLVFHRSMIRNNRPSTIKIYPSGGHGWGYNRTFEWHEQMTNDLKQWLKDLANTSTDTP